MRSLSLYESFFRCRTVNGYYNGFQVTATYSSPLSLHKLYWALAATLVDYPILASNVFRKDKDYVVAPLDRITLKQVVSIIDSNHPDYDVMMSNGTISETGMKYLNSFVFQVDCQLPLFKVFLFGDNVLSVVLDHTLYDGLVGNYFHELLLKKLRLLPEDVDEVSMDDEVFVHCGDNLCSYPEPIDCYFPEWEIPFTDDPNHFTKQVPLGLDKWKGRFPGAKGVSIAFKLINVPSQDLVNILSNCKLKNVTLTSYIEAVFLKTFQPVFGDNYTHNKVAITLRRFVPNCPEFLVNNLAHTGLPMNFPPINDFSWDLVQTINQNLKSSITNPKIMNVMMPFKQTYIPGDNNLPFFDSLLGKVKPETLKLSNLGFIRLPADGLTITDMIFSQDVSAVTSEFMINVISTSIGGLNIVMSYFDHSFEDVEYDSFDGLMDDFRSNLLCLHTR